MADSNQFSLLGQRRFAPFFATQFLGAFNDNIFRNGLIIVITFQGITVFGLNASELANIAGALFILPFLLFSAPAGQLADKYEKSGLMRAIKVFEIGLMVIAGVAFTRGHFGLLFLVLFLMGCQSTLFGPVKFAYIPQNLSTDELIGGNALVESGTYLAIILGLVVGGLSVAVDPAGRFVLTSCLVSVAVLGYVSSRAIPETRPVDPGLRISFNLWRDSWQIIGFARENRSVFLSVLGISWFWFFGTAITLQIPAYTLDILNGNETITTIVLVAFVVGVALGALLCEKMSGRRIELGLVPFGSIGLSLFSIDLYFARPTLDPTAVSTFSELIDRPGNLRVLIDMAMLGAFGGLYSVPLYALIQERATRQHLSRIIAANNIINSIFMIAAAAMALALLGLGFSIPELFAVLGLLNILVAIYIYTLLPEFLMRFVAWILVNTLYRIRVSGVDRIPDDGPAVLVCNHVSYADALIVGGSIPRPARFVMWYRIFDIPFLRFIFRHARAIPIASAREDEQVLAEAYARIDSELADGNVVCIFPEGGITRDGNIHEFRPGIEKIIAKRPVPVIPIGLAGMWGSWFSRRRNGSLRRLPGRLFARVEVRIGEPVKPADVTARGLELLVSTLRGRDR